MSQGEWIGLRKSLLCSGFAAPNPGASPVGMSSDAHHITYFDEFMVT